MHIIRERGYLEISTMVFLEILFAWFPSPMTNHVSKGLRRGGSGMLSLY